MFKAKLIEDKTYYRLRRRQLLFLLLPAIPFGILVNFFDLPIWLTTIGLGAYILILYFGVKNQKGMFSLLGNRIIEIDYDAIRIKSKNGMSLESFDPNSVQLIRIKESYNIPNEKVKDMTREAKGNPTTNYISILTNDQELRFDFELDSYYMITQLDKVISHWKNKGYRVAVETPRE